MPLISYLKRKSLELCALLTDDVPAGAEHASSTSAHHLPAEQSSPSIQPFLGRPTCAGRTTPTDTMAASGAGHAPTTSPRTQDRQLGWPQGPGQLRGLG